MKDVELSIIRYVQRKHFAEEIHRFKEVDMEVDEVVFYTDSKIVLGYIQKKSRRFYF